MISTHARTDARRRALDILFGADLLGRPIADALQSEPAVDAKTRTIVAGVAGHAAEIDAIIGAASDRWTIERMPIVDRNLLRIGVFEILWDADVPPGAAINDLVSLGKLLSTEDSGRFINGLLGRVARDHPRS